MIPWFARNMMSSGSTGCQEMESPTAAVSSGTSCCCWFAPWQAPASNTTAAMQHSKAGVSTRLFMTRRLLRQMGTPNLSAVSSSGGRLLRCLLRRHSTAPTAASYNGVCLAAGPWGHRRVEYLFLRGCEGDSANMQAGTGAGKDKHNEEESGRCCRWRSTS